MASNDFGGQVALVTGGGSGIGRFTCLKLARDGAHVVVTDVSLEAASQTLSMMPNPEDHLALQMDVTRQSDVQGVISASQDRFGKPPSLLVNSAGIGLLAPFLDATEECIDKYTSINLKGTMLVTQIFIKALLHGNDEPSEGKGAVVNISSMSGKTGLTGMTVYASTKAGVIAFSKSCAAEMARKGIRVNCVLPALIDTPMATGIAEPLHRSYCAKNPLGRLGKPEGGGSGIGRATCLQLAKEGAKVVVTSRTMQAAQETLSLLSNGTDHLALQMDVTQQKAVEEVMAAIRERFGKSPTLLVNCAGFFERTPVVEMEESSFNTAIDVNLKGTFLMTQAVTKAILADDKEGEKEGKGAIVNIASISGKTGFPGASHCAASKGGVVALTKSCAAEMASKGIRVNCVLPGIIDTPMARRVDEKVIQKHISVNPLGRAGRPEEVAEVVVFLLSARSSYMVGACVEVTGGTGM